MGFSLSDLGDDFVGTVTMGQCDGSGCGSGHRGSGMEAGIYNKVRGNQQSPASQSFQTTWSGLDDNTKRLIIYAGFGVTAYIVFELLLKII